VSRGGVALALATAALLGGCEVPLSSTAAPAAAENADAPVVSAQPAAPPIPTPPRVDAGYRILDAGSVQAGDTLETLRARFGAANVVPARVPGAEGEEFDGLHLFPSDPKQRAYLYLDDAGVHPALVRIVDRESLWQRSDGIRMGITLTELAARNDAPVGFTGFDWDYGGSCCDWNGGRLERDPPTGGMTLCPPATDATADPGYPMGDAQFDSNHPWVVAHPPVVCEFAIALAPPAPPDVP
jgi:hypothetical protein